ncbi:MAG: FAD:protein FMN transferase, partial [Verrucomicrobiaceae bacterium]
TDGWNVGVRPGKEQSGKLLLKNAAVSTSGDLHQSIEIGGVRYSHIIDPVTGLGLTRHIAATIIAKDATTSDALATACCVAPPDKARQTGISAGATEVITA